MKTKSETKPQEPKTVPKSVKSTVAAGKAADATEEKGYKPELDEILDEAFVGDTKLVVQIRKYNEGAERVVIGKRFGTQVYPVKSMSLENALLVADALYALIDDGIDDDEEEVDEDAEVDEDTDDEDEE